MGQNSEFKIDIVRIVRAVWRKLWIVVLSVIICGGAGYCYSKYFISPTYSAQALMYVNNSSINIGSTSLAISSSDLTAAQELVETYIVILKTRSTLNEVIEKTGVEYSYETLKGMISAGAVSSTEIFSITVTSTNKEETELLANAIAQVLPNRIAEIVDGASVRIVDYAVVPTSKVGPSNTKNAAIGVLIGVFFSVGLITLFEILDTVIHDEEYLTNEYKNIPVLSVIPNLDAPQSTGKGYGYGYGYGQTKDEADGKKGE